MSKKDDAEDAFGAPITPLKSENPIEFGLFTPELLRARAEERMRRGDKEGAKKDQDWYDSEMMKTLGNDIFGEEENTGEEQDPEVMDTINYGPKKTEADEKMEMETEYFGNDLGFDYNEKLPSTPEKEKGGRLNKKRRNTKRNTKRKIKRTRRKGRKVTKRKKHHNRRK
jgi:hypothetical protein